MTPHPPTPTPKMRDDAHDADPDDLSIHSTRHALLDKWQAELEVEVDSECDDMVSLPSSIGRLSQYVRVLVAVAAVLLLLVGVVAWSGRPSSLSYANFFPSSVLGSPPHTPSIAASTQLLTVQRTAQLALGLSSLLSDASPSAPNPSSEPPHRPAAFMNLLHNTLLPDLSLSNQPYPVNTTRLPGGEMPELSVYYTMSGDWFHYILDETLPAVFKSYRRVEVWDNDMPNLWSLQSFSDDGRSVPVQMNRSIGQRRIFLTGEPGQPESGYFDVDAIFDTKTSPFSHPPGITYVYFPNVYASHYDFIMSGQPKDEQPKYDLSLVKPPNYSQLTNFTQRRFMAYMQGHCVSYRDDFFDLVSRYRHVDAIGSCRHNVADSFDRKDAWWQAVQIYSNYKFVLTLESAIVDGYITEKILGPMITGAIPVYIGSSDIGDHFNERAFINVGRFSSLEKVMERIIYLDSNDTAYAEMLDEPWLQDNRPSLWMPHNNTGSYLHQQLAALRDVLLHPNYTLQSNDGLPNWAKEKQGWQSRNTQYLRGS